MNNRIDAGDEQQAIAKGLKLIEALAEDHESRSKNGEHDWRRCRTCLACEELDNPHTRDLLRAVLAMLRRARAEGCPDPTDPRRI